MKLWEWIAAGFVGLLLLYSLLKSKTNSSVIIDSSTGSSSQGNLHSVLDSISFGSGLLTPLTSLFGGGSGASSSPFTSTGGVLVGGGSSYGPQPVISQSAVGPSYGSSIPSSSIADEGASGINFGYSDSGGDPGGGDYGSLGSID